MFSRCFAWPTYSESELGRNNRSNRSSSNVCVGARGCSAIGERRTGTRRQREEIWPQRKQRGREDTEKRKFIFSFSALSLLSLLSLRQILLLLLSIPLRSPACRAH